LNNLEAKLDPRQFCRIHRSYLLNVNYLARIETETKDSKLAILTTGKELPISRNGYLSLKKLL
jgi:two-component system LytT family response regulator